jgi:uncharacterized protein
MRLRRRTFLTRSAALAAAGALPFVFGARRARAANYGPLEPDPEELLDLPSGFSYAVLERQGQTMSDGYRVPGKPDGMACFPGPNGSLVLLRNHEVTTNANDSPYASGQAAPPEAYDAGSFGGVTRLVVDATTFERLSSNLVLAGTAQNCAGGPSPWGWLSCEEAFDSQHGYVFVCPADASAVTNPVRVVGYGHFRHEAVAIETPSNRAYLTEDRPDSCLYRFVPDAPDQPFVGKLQALGIADEPGLDTSADLEVGDQFDVIWIDLEDPDPSSDSLRDTAVDAGAAVIRRGEGIWYHDGVVYFDATSGGPAGLGQIFALRPTADGGTLTLIAQSGAGSELDGPDNLTVAPWGDLVVAEDALSGSGVHHLRGITPQGEIYDIARTRRSELAGVCFSPDGRALFVNVWGSGVTLVVTGPFPEVPDGAGGAGGQGGQANEAGAAGQGDNAGAGGANDGSAGDPGGGTDAGAPAETGGNAGTPGVAGSTPGAGTGSNAAGTSGSGAGTGATSGSGGATSAGAGGSAGGGRGGATAGMGGTSGKAAAQSPATAADDGACGCRVGPGAPSGNAGGLVAVIGAAAALVARRSDEHHEPDEESREQ